MSHQQSPRPHISQFSLKQNNSGVFVPRQTEKAEPPVKVLHVGDGTHSGFLALADE